MRIKSITAILISLIIGASCTSTADNSLTADGFGPVRLGSVIKSLPASVPNLYDRIEAEKVEEFDYEAIEYNLLYQGERIARLIENEGKVHAIEIVSDKLQTSDGFGLNKTAAEILSAGGAAYCDNYGFGGLLYKGILFFGMELTASGQKKADDAYFYGTDQVFTESDFKTGTRPSKIILANWYADSTE